MGYSKEQLLENLPDYVNNKITDDELREAIFTEISSNPDFKDEYILIKSAFKSITGVEFTEPPINYFNNLLPTLNKKINEKSERYGFAKYFSKLWKYAIPIAAVIIFFIGYKTIFRNNEYLNNLNSDSQIVIKELNYSDEKKTEVSEKPAENKEIETTEKISDSNAEKLNRNSYKQRTSEKTYLSKKEEIQNVLIDINDNSPDEEIFFTEDELNIEQNFEKMSNEEQNNLINKIKNSNL